MEIREYTPDDKEEIVEMVSEILQEMFNGNPEEFGMLKEFNVNKNYIHYLIATLGGKIIGTGALKKINRDEVRLKRMYVMEEYRRRGIAQKILNQLIQFAREHDFKKIRFNTYPTMKHARRFHKRNGFTELISNDPYQIHLVKKL